MALTPVQRAELEALGQETVRAKLIQPGAGRGAALPGFKTGIHGGHLTRGDIEDWLAEKHADDLRVRRSTVTWAWVGKAGTALLGIAAIFTTIWPQEIGHALISVFVAVRSLLGL
jgi:hypothetical protein